MNFQKFPEHTIARRINENEILSALMDYSDGDTELYLPECEGHSDHLSIQSERRCQDV